MKAKRLMAISASVLTAAWITADAGMTLAQTKSKDTKVNPNLNPSVGASQSERTGGDSGTPLPEKSPMTGTVEKGSGPTNGSGSSGTTKGSRSTGTSKGTSQSRTKDGKTINPDLNPSVGGSQSERTGSDSATPLPKGSPSTGTVEKGTGSSR